MAHRSPSDLSVAIFVFCFFCFFAWTLPFLVCGSRWTIWAVVSADLPSSVISARMALIFSVAAVVPPQAAPTLVAD
eukprot:2401368-Prymnesium_polylepis.1